MYIMVRTCQRMKQWTDPGNPALNKIKINVVVFGHQKQRQAIKPD